MRENHKKQNYGVGKMIWTIHTSPKSGSLEPVNVC